MTEERQRQLFDLIASARELAWKASTPTRDVLRELANEVETMTPIVARAEFNQEVADLTEEIKNG